MDHQDKPSFIEQCKDNLAYVTILAILAAMFLVGVVLQVASEGATAVPTAVPAAVSAERINRCASTDRACRLTPARKRWNRNFRDGRYGRASGFNPSQVFANPKRARRMIVRRIDANMRAARAAGTGRESAGAMGSSGDYLVARGRYYKMTTEAKCVAQGRAHSYPIFPTDCYPNSYEAKPMTMYQAGQALELTTCVGSTIMSFVYTPATIRYIAVGLAGSSCLGSAMQMGTTR